MEEQNDRVGGESRHILQNAVRGTYRVGVLVSREANLCSCRQCGQDAQFEKKLGVYSASVFIAESKTSIFFIKDSRLAQRFKEPNKLSTLTAFQNSLQSSCFSPAVPQDQYLHSSESPCSPHFSLYLLEQLIRGTKWRAGKSLILSWGAVENIKS